MTITRRNLFIAAGATTLLSTLNTSFAIAATSAAPKNIILNALVNPDRDYLLTLLKRIASPILISMSNNQLKQKFQLELSPTWDANINPDVAYFEAFGRLMSGISPWLALPNDYSAESESRVVLLDAALKSYTNAVDPKSPDYLLWNGDDQILAGAAFLTQSFIRAPNILWEPLSKKTKTTYIKLIKGLRKIKPHDNSSLLFSAMNEAFLFSINEDGTLPTISLAIQKMDECYGGDGWIKDGDKFGFNYYNSYVIYPMLIQIIKLLIERNINYPDGDLTAIYEKNLQRMQRYSEYLERFISPDGSFPPFGRSITNRTAAFQPLAWLALHKKLSPKHSENQIRGALTAVHKKTFNSPDNFNEEFLTLGFAGHQPEAADSYSNSGSMYITTESLLILGLPITDRFWSEPAQDWTQKKAFSGQTFLKDSRFNG